MKYTNVTKEIKGNILFSDLEVGETFLNHLGDIRIKCNQHSDRGLVGQSLPWCDPNIRVQRIMIVNVDYELV